jgi:hypothetical protein
MVTRKTMKPILVIVAALVAGFVGGILSGRVARTGDQRVVRARSFELVNETGQTISFWGVDNGQNAVLTFGSRGFALEGARPHSLPVGLGNPHNQLTAFGLQANDSPLLKMSGTDGKTRVRLLLSQDNKPVLTMEDENGPRVSLGIEQSDTPGPEDNNWSLVFAQERARIGMGTEKEGGRRYVRGVLFVNPDKVEYPYPQPK